MRVPIGKLLAAILLTLCIGVQVLEATGRWDRTIQDTGDEAIIVTVVLCVGAALLSAGSILLRLRLSSIGARFVLPRLAAPATSVATPISPSLCASPPLSLRI